MELIPFDLYQNHGGEIRCISRPPSARNVGEAEKGFQIGSVVGVVNGRVSIYIPTLFTT